MVNSIFFWIAMVGLVQVVVLEVMDSKRRRNAK